MSEPKNTITFGSPSLPIGHMRSGHVCSGHVCSIPTGFEARTGNTLIEIDPNNLKAGDPGAKMDAGKIRVGLLRRFGLALLAVADLSTGGAEKYSAHGWAAVENGAERYEDAMFGHMLKEMFEKKDPDMRVAHEVSTAWNALARLQLLIENDAIWKARLLARKATEPRLHGNP